MEFNRFDVSAKELVWDDPAACMERFAIGPPGPVTVIDSDFTTLTGVADNVLKVGGSDPDLVNVESELHQTFRDCGLWPLHVSAWFGRGHWPTNLGRQPDPDVARASCPRAALTDRTHMRGWRFSV